MGSDLVETLARFYQPSRLGCHFMRCLAMVPVSVMPGLIGKGHRIDGMQRLP